MAPILGPLRSLHSHRRTRAAIKVAFFGMIARKRHALFMLSSSKPLPRPAANSCTVNRQSRRSSIMSSTSRSRRGVIQAASRLSLCFPPRMRATRTVSTSTRRLIDNGSVAFLEINDRLTSWAAFIAGMSTMLVKRRSTSLLAADGSSSAILKYSHRCWTANRHRSSPARMTDGWAWPGTRLCSRRQRRGYRFEFRPRSRS
jgi:hypothetical protein